MVSENDVNIKKYGLRDSREESAYSLNSFDHLSFNRYKYKERMLGNAIAHHHHASNLCKVFSRNF